MNLLGEFNKSIEEDDIGRGEIQKKPERKSNDISK